MSLSNQFPDRGKVGPTPAMTTRADETFLNYVKDLRSVLLWGASKDIHPKANAEIQKEKIVIEPTKESVEAVRKVVREKIPEAGVWSRVYRATQDALWNRVSESYDLRDEEFLRLLEESDKMGPGSVTWDPDYVYPNYANVETHRQNDGYVGHPLAGLRYDYGTRIFAGNVSKDDQLHKAMAEKISAPQDGKVECVMDLACAIGRLTCQLKHRFPEADVWGSDISAPMVRYAHYRALEQGVDVHFLQKAAEDLDDFPENHYDLITVHILFHEVPTPVVDRTIANVYRMLRPGGTFWISDFPTLREGQKDHKGIKYTGLLGSIDSADNNEPYAPEFVRSNIEDKLKNLGFTLRYEDPEDMVVYGRVCDKPV